MSNKSCQAMGMFSFCFISCFNFTYYYESIIGAPALLVIASNEGDIFFVDPYKSHENLFKYSAVTLPAHKIHSIDILWTINGTYLFWSDHNSKALYSTLLDNPVRKSNRTTRDVNTVKTIVSY